MIKMVRDLIHYYFKFQKGNKGIETLKKNNNLKNGDIVPLCIYFGKLKAEEIDDFIKTPENYELDKGKTFTKSQIKQVEVFKSIEKESNETYFWIFYEDNVFCFKPIDGKIYNEKDEWKDSNGSLPKAIKAELKFCKKKYELPEVFANINANQKYNRVTIKELTNAEKEIANCLVDNKLIEINKENFSQYLSPVEFETLIFLIFNHDGSFCSSFRGGTLEGFDLKISISDKFKKDNLDDISCGNHFWIQAKKKDDINSETQKEIEDHPTMILIYNGKKIDMQNRILGKNWLTKIINEREDILCWLKKMTFNYPEIFHFEW